MKDPSKKRGEGRDGGIAQRSLKQGQGSGLASMATEERPGMRGPSDCSPSCSSHIPTLLSGMATASIYLQRNVETKEFGKAEAPVDRVRLSPLRNYVSTSSGVEGDGAIDKRLRETLEIIDDRDATTTIALIQASTPTRWQPPAVKVRARKGVGWV